MNAYAGTGRLVRLAGQSPGVGTRADIADYHRLKGEQVDAVIADSGLVPVTVEGWGKPAWADPAALETPPRGRHRTTLLSPFDSLIWERARTERIFGFTRGETEYRIDVADEKIRATRPSIYPRIHRAA